MLRFVGHPFAQRSSAPREHTRYWVRVCRGNGEAKSVVQNRFGFPENSVEHFAEKGREPCSVVRWHRQNLSDTNLLVAPLFDELATASSDSAWKVERRVAR